MIKVIRLMDIAEWERAKKGCIYPKGSILLQVSATKGQMLHMDYDGGCDSKYLVIRCKEPILTKYLYYRMQAVIEDFLEVYQTGLNINPDILRFLEVMIETDIHKQQEFITMIEALDTQIQKEEHQIEELIEYKRAMLERMFAKGNCTGATMKESKNEQRQQRDS